METSGFLSQHVLRDAAGGALLWNSGAVRAVCLFCATEEEARAVERQQGDLRGCVQWVIEHTPPPLRISVLLVILLMKQVSLLPPSLTPWWETPDQSQGYLVLLRNSQNSSAHFKPLIEWSSWRSPWRHLANGISYWPRPIFTSVSQISYLGKSIREERFISQFWMFQYIVSRLWGKQEVMMGNSGLRQIIQFTDARKWERGRRSNVLILPSRICSNDNFLPLGPISSQ